MAVGLINILRRRGVVFQPEEHFKLAGQECLQNIGYTHWCFSERIAYL